MGGGFEAIVDYTDAYNPYIVSSGRKYLPRPSTQRGVYEDIEEV